ncbi:hypothetical protein [Rhodococcus sp. AG1013]|uniref:hypothetical protein n=1 Tax=unclassified Rhodococcus (in: high G+C Gram-positive bacteria) TaxID=192944 RepID=UPI0011C04B16|nr:hypothetical protein [Rhodococcus sp. AG1013]
MARLDGIVRAGVAACFDLLAPFSVRLCPTHECGLSGIAVDYAPTFIGPTLQVGTAGILPGSTVIETKGAVAAILQLLGTDTGSLGS